MMEEKDEEIKDSSWLDTLKMMAYWLVRIPGMLLDRQRDK